MESNTLMEQTLMQVLATGTPKDMRRKVTKWWREMVHPDDYDHFRELYEGVMVIINEYELKEREAQDIENQRDDALDKLEESERTNREQLDMINQQAVHIEELYDLIRTNFQQSELFQVLTDLGAVLVEE